MSDKIEIDIDSTALGSAHCRKKFFLNVIGSITDGKVDGGYYQPPAAAAIYGVAVHKFIDVMFKTNGHGKRATDEMLKVFNLPKKPAPEKQQYLADERHLQTTAWNVWNDKIVTEQTYEILSIPSKCYWCQGINDPNTICSVCNNTGIVNGPASELTFRILIYEDNLIRVYLDGTIDNLGKFDKGCYAIRDFKTTSSYRQDDFISNFELSRQLRIYILACHLMAKREPDSILGKVGLTRMGAFIDAIFLKSKANDNEYLRSPVYQYSEQDLLDFKLMLQNFCQNLSDIVDFQIRGHTIIPKDGILNSTCNIYGKCKYWACCATPRNVEEVLLKRDFTRKIYNPLNFNDTE